jgi:phosphocarrier protein HPr
VRGPLSNSAGKSHRAASSHDQFCRVKCITMQEVTLTIRNKVGLHARPAALFVQTAKQFKSDIKLTCGERQANAKSILNVLTMGVEQGAAVTVRAEGEDADQALAALEALVENNFGEEE